jgi:predicted O-methyltransferase YrrM
MYGCSTGKPDNVPEVVCECLTGGHLLDTGAGFEDADAEIFVHLRRVMPRRNISVFAIGNAFGYSTTFLGLLFAQAGHGFVDVIDAENEGGCNAAGTWLTSALAAEASIDVRLTVGHSPDQIPKAVRAPFVYDIAFIDGWHSYDQLLADFEALEPYMAPKSVMVLHDVGLFELYSAVEKMSMAWQRHYARGRAYKNLVGTMLLYRGFPKGVFDYF